MDDLKRAGAEVMVFILPRVYLGFDKPTGEPASAAENDPARRMERVLKTDQRWIDQLEAVIAKRGVKTQMARGYFKGKGTEEEIYRDDGVHLNPKGHHAYAEFIEGKIRGESLRFTAWMSGAKGDTPKAPVPAAPVDNTQPAVDKN